MPKSSLTPDERRIIDDLTALGHELSTLSQQIEVYSNDPRAVSLMLFRRLWSHHTGYIVLFKAHHYLEADIILRAALEAAICISANFVLGEAFYTLLQGDLAATLKGQIKRFREEGDLSVVQEGEALLRTVLPKAPDKPRQFNWKELAEIGGQPTLYLFHKMLSSVSSHVSAFSLLRGVVGVDGSLSAENDELTDLEGALHPMMLAGATLIGVKLHAAMIAASDIESKAIDIEQRLNVSSLRFRHDQADPSR